MSATSDMTTAIENLKAALAADAPVTDAHINDLVTAAVNPLITDLQTKISTITASEADDATKLADLTSAFGVFTAAFTPAAS